MADNNEMLIQILQTLNNFQLQTTAAFSEVRAEIKKSREIENEHWQENLRRWDENDKRWEENNRRWDENDANWKNYEKNRKTDISSLTNILYEHEEYITSIAKDKNMNKKAI